MLLSETTGEETLRYYYDSTGKVVSLTYRKGEGKEKSYFYARNAQGDIIALYRSSDSKLIGTYEYDLWGKPVSIKEAATGMDTDGILEKNPFRYRSYYYDGESGFYYLKARYYDPAIRRFISADSMNVLLVDTLSTKSKNLFTYAENNPVMAKDSTGNAFETVFDIISLVCSIIDVYKNPMDIVAWYGLIGDAADLLLPGVAGIGETVRGIKAASRAAEAGDTVTDAVKIANKGGCFVAGTPVVTKEGLRSIEEIQPGDLVYAKNTDTGERGWKRVVRLFLNESEELIHIHIGGEETIATPDHPFWVEGRGFIAAAYLKPGDRVETTEGEILTITRVEREVLDAPIPVYNFEVEDWHTYYVSEEKVLVHNMCSVGVGIGRGSDVIKTNRIPDNDSTIGHIFRNAEGHIPDTPDNRELLEDVANNLNNFRGKDKYGNEWYTMDLEDGRQVWVESRNGNIFEGGINETLKPWNPETGLKKP